MKIMLENNWIKSETLEFWSEAKPREHHVEFYADEQGFVESLIGFVATGIIAGESVIVIANKQHVATLNERLSRQFDLQWLQENKMYVIMDADETLEKLMVDGWPDAEKFQEVIKDTLIRARIASPVHAVRAFGEMAAILWKKGMSEATVQLETLWNELLQTLDFILYCAYPKNSFTQEGRGPAELIHHSHSHVFESSKAGCLKIYHRNL
jgi:hypothetical protein